jgi:hypothetical protein
MRYPQLTAPPGRHDRSVYLRDEAVIDEGAPIGSGQIRRILSTTVFRHGEAMALAAGIFQAVGESRPLANNPNQYATTVVHVSGI